MIRLIRSKAGYILAFIAILVMLGVLYYFGIYGPCETRAAQLQQSINECDEEIQLEAARSSRIEELERLTEAGKSLKGRVYGYDREKDELTYLSEVMNAAISYELSFNEPVVYGGTYVRRTVNISFNVGSYETCGNIFRQLIDCPYRTILRSFSITPYGGTGSSIRDRSLSGGSCASATAELVFIEYIDETTDTRGLNE